MTASSTEPSPESPAAGRVTAVEEKLAHLEHSVGDLDAMVYRQQQTIEQLEHTIQQLEQRIKRLSEKLEGGGDDDAPELPPHY
jgi:SlyX protein